MTIAAALVAAVLSTLCCIGPLLYLLFGISAAGLIGIPGAAWLQVPMSIVSVVLMCGAFWRIYVSRKPLCVSVIGVKAMQVLFWVGSVFAVFLLTYPYVLPWLWGEVE